MKHVYVPGLVLHLDTGELVRLGAQCTDSTQVAVKGSHFFLCVGVDANEGMWTPTFSDPCPGRKMIESGKKKGHQKWTAGNTYYNPLQLWRASHKAVQVAAKKGKDQSRGDAQNVVETDAVPSRTDFPEFPSTATATGGSGA